MSVKWIEAYENFWLKKVDARIYELFRIAFGILVLVNLASLWPIRDALLTSDGLTDVKLSSYVFKYTTSIFWYWYSPSFISGAFIVAGIACVCLSAGLLTRFAAVVVFLFQLSYSIRIDLARSGWDVVLVSMAFTLMIAPIGRVWNLDSYFKKKGREKLVSSPVYALRFIQIQITLIYLEALFTKMSDEDWQNGNAVAYFTMSGFSSLQSAVFYKSAWLSPSLTYLTLAVELVLPAFLWTKKFRFSGFLIGFMFHAIAGFTQLYLFSLVMMVSYLAFLDDDDLKQILALVRQIESGSKHN